VPKVGIIGPGKDDTEVNARMISMAAPHPAIGLTSAVAVAAAATMPGTVVYQVAPASPTYRIGTLSGSVSLRIAEDDGSRSVAFRRNARRIADAVVYVSSTT
jgi:2-methylaconitate cis-trans-isomerase PrpF